MRRQKTNLLGLGRTRSKLVKIRNLNFICDRQVWGDTLQNANGREWIFRSPLLLSPNASSSRPRETGRCIQAATHVWVRGPDAICAVLQQRLWHCRAASRNLYVTAANPHHLGPLNWVRPDRSCAVSEWRSHLAASGNS